MVPTQPNAAFNAGMGRNAGNMVCMSNGCLLRICAFEFTPSSQRQLLSLCLKIMGLTYINQASIHGECQYVDFDFISNIWGAKEDI